MGSPLPFATWFSGVDLPPITKTAKKIAFPKNKLKGWRVTLLRAAWVVRDFNRRNMKMMKLSAALMAALIVTACDKAYAESGYGSYSGTYVVKAAGQTPLTASNGMTLYTFDRDTAGTSNCYGDCAESWPPFAASASATPPSSAYTKVQRKDGKLQWAKNGAPLYFWVGDRQPGDTNGDGVGGVWHVAR